MTPENMDDLDHALRLAQEQRGGVTHPEITRLREALAAETKARETAEARVHDLNVVVDNWRGLHADAEATSTTLRAELAKAREALEPFAEAAASYDPDEGDSKDVAWSHDFTIGSLRRARTALTSGAPKGEE
jgi:hypothetical protein